MREALGLVETRGLSTAILAADTMVKTANVSIIELENTRGSGYMTIKISGDVGAVNAAVTCGKRVAIENKSFISAKVIPRPSTSIEVIFCQPNNKNNDVSKEDTAVEKESVNNKETVVETKALIKEDSKKEETLISDINKTENIEDKVEETSNKKEEEPINQSNSKPKVSGPKKSKSRKNNTKN